jgi:hypothetical protein
VKPSEKLVFHDRLKYIEIKHYILCDKVHKREVVLQYISTDEKIADILVKASIQDEKFADKLGLVKTTSLLGSDYSQVGREH